VGPWHGQTVLHFPVGVVATTEAVADDGTFFLATTRVESGDELAFWRDPTLGRTTIQALAPDGSGVAGWPTDGIVLDGWAFELSVMAGGDLLVASAVGPAGHVAVHALGRKGAERTGWPVKFENGSPFMGQPFVVGRAGGEACWLESTAPSRDPSDGTRLACADSDGMRIAASSKADGTIVDRPVRGSEGETYLRERPDFAAIGRIIALDENGRPVVGWTPYPATDEVVQLVASPAGGALAILRPKVGSAYVVRLGPDGSERWRATLPAGHEDLIVALRGSELSTSQDGTAFLASGAFAPTADPPRVAGFGADGSQPPGWPVQVPGAPVMALANADGTVWAWWGTGIIESGGDVTLGLIDREGSMRPGWPVQASGLGTVIPTVDGRAFAVEGRGGAATLDILVATSEP
jgi:hypothetical protein